MGICANVGRWQMTSRFDNRMTNVCKGVAVILLLCHHLFGIYGDNLGVCLKVLRSSGKLCVAMFLFLSGFGLTRAAMRDATVAVGWGLSNAIFRTFRLLANFWFAAVPFILMSCLFTDRGFSQVYPDGWFPWFPLEMIGVRSGINGFNPTWWFMALIVPLYLIHPALEYGLRRLEGANRAWWILLMAILAMRRGVLVAGFPFFLGMAAGKSRKFDGMPSEMGAAALTLCGAAVPAVLTARCVTGASFLLEGAYAALVCFCLFAVSSRLPQRLSALSGALGFVGRHSMNVFFIHTFIFYYFYKGFFKALHPLVGLCILLVASLACSITLEWMKSFVRFNALLERVRVAISRMEA